MSTPAPVSIPSHIRCTALGHFGSSDERFSYGINMLDTAGGQPAIAGNQAIWDDIRADFAAYHSDATVRLNGRAILDEVKFARIGADGRYAEDPYISVVPGGIGGGVAPSANDTCPPQVALAISLTTARRGPSGRGRFYLPLPNVGIDASMTMTQTQAQSIADRTSTFLTSLNDLPGVDSQPAFRVVVVSTKGFFSEVTGCRVGRALDTVRSRRTSLPELHSAAAAAVVN